LLKSVVKTVPFLSKIMHDKVLIISYSVVTVIVGNYTKHSLENKWCSKDLVKWRVCVCVFVCRIDKMSAGQVVQEILGRNLADANQIVK
jgi:hypothetical protein